ncbi:MAG: hypothetical protein ACREJC_15200, partial [Tepidisphaeraceae bacterium]
MPAVGIMGRQGTKHRRNRRMSGQNNRPQRPTPIGIVSAAYTGATQLDIVFNQPVSLNGIPQFPRTGGTLPTAAQLTSPTSVRLTYPAGGPAPSGLSVPADDPAIRNTSGGFVTPSE